MCSIDNLKGLELSSYNYQLESAIKGIALAPNPPFNTYGRALGNIEIGIGDTTYTLTTRPQDGFEELIDLDHGSHVIRELGFLLDFMTRTNTRLFYQYCICEERFAPELDPPEEFQVSVTDLNDAMAMPEFPKFDDREDILLHTVANRLELINDTLHLYSLLLNRNLFSTHETKKLSLEDLPNALDFIAAITNLFGIDLPSESFEFYRVETTGDLVVTAGEDITIAVNTLNADTVKTFLGLRRCPIRTMEVDIEKL